MATEKTKAEKEYTVEERLKTLYELQTMLSEIDRIKTLRGELPLEVKDLEDEIARLETRVQKFQGEIVQLQSDIAKEKEGIKNSQTLIEKYTAQQDNVRNNREFDFLTKEIEERADEPRRKIHSRIYGSGKEQKRGNRDLSNHYCRADNRLAREKRGTR